MKVETNDQGEVAKVYFPKKNYQIVGNDPVYLQLGELRDTTLRALYWAWRHGLVTRTVAQGLVKYSARTATRLVEYTFLAESEVVDRPCGLQVCRSKVVYY